MIKKPKPHQDNADAETLPNLYTRKAPLPLPVSVLADAFHSLRKSKTHAAFIKSCEDRNLTVNVKPELVNLLKTHIVQNNLHVSDPVAAGFAKSTDPRCTPDPNSAP